MTAPGTNFSGLVLHKGGIMIQGLSPMEMYGDKKKLISAGKCFHWNCYKKWRSNISSQSVVMKQNENEVIYYPLLYLWMNSNVDDAASGYLILRQ